jgi:hypothetical protein
VKNTRVFKTESKTLKSNLDLQYHHIYMSCQCVEMSACTVCLKAVNYLFRSAGGALQSRLLPTSGIEVAKPRPRHQGMLSGEH